MTTDQHVSMAVLRDAVAQAVLAPSVYNTQPWKFHIEGDRIELFADWSRQAMVLDPTGRQLYISCGAALHRLDVALRGAGCHLLMVSIRHTVSSSCDPTDRQTSIPVPSGN